MPTDEVRALTFFALILAIIGLILINRSFSASVWTAVRRPNPTLLWILLSIAAILALTLQWPLAAHLFRFGPLHLDDRRRRRVRLSRRVKILARRVAINVSAAKRTSA